MNERFVIFHEPSKCIWSSPDAIPEVDITVSTEIERFCSKDAAENYLLDYLAQRGANPTWADVRPIEECARCERDFETRERHLAITLIHERGGESFEDCEELDCWYVARFCPECAAIVDKDTK